MRAFTPKDTAWTKATLKVKDVLQAAATVAGRTELKIFTSEDRSDMDALSESETPAIIIGVVRVDFSHSEMQAQMQHDGQLRFSVQSGLQTGFHIDQSNQDIIAFIVETLAASNYLDGWVEFLDPSNMDASEQAAPDVGEALLLVDVTLYTPTNDFRTIVASSGEHI